MIEKLKQQIEADEGRVHCVYLDTHQLKTAGVGHLLVEGKDPEYDWPVGAPVTYERVAEWFEEDIKATLNECCWLIDDFEQLPEEVQLIIANMMYNLGRPRLSKFIKFLAAVDRRDWTACAREMADSKWHRQVQNRSGRLIERMLDVAKSGDK